MYDFAFTPESLSAVAGIVLSLLFSYAPGLSDWYHKFNKEQKQLIMLVLLFLVSAGAFGLVCAGIITGAVCSVPGAINVAVAFFMAVITNQTVHKISPKLKKFRKIEPSYEG